MVPTNEMRFCGEPTADFDTAGEYLRVWYDKNCPELHLGGILGAWNRWKRRFILGYVDYDVNRDRHNLMLGLINEVGRIEDERKRQVQAIIAAKFADKL